MEKMYQLLIHICDILLRVVSGHGLYFTLGSRKTFYRRLRQQMTCILTSEVWRSSKKSFSPTTGGVCPLSSLRFHSSQCNNPCRSGHVLFVLLY